jgi:hypothetical protein
MSRATEPADSAGQSWSGRHFEANSFASDDGRADPALLDALERFAAGATGAAEVVQAFAHARLLIPLVAHAGEAGVDEHGHRYDKTQELSIVTVAAPDGRAVLPVFTSVATMQTWNAAARPVPAEGVRVALAAAAENTDLVVIDPTSPTEFAVRRPALWALARGEEWVPSFEAPEVLQALERSIGTELAVQHVTVRQGDPTGRLLGPELVVELALTPGLTERELDAVLSRLAERWAADDTIATRADSLSVTLVAA